MEHPVQENVLSYIKEQIAGVDQQIADLQLMEEFINCGYVDLKPIPVGRDESYQKYSGQHTAWVTPQCPSENREQAQAIVKKLEDKSNKLNEYFKTSTPITNETFVNICKAVGKALMDFRRSYQDAIDLVSKSG